MLYTSKTINKKNSTFILLNSLIFFISIVILLPLHIGQAKDLGCCIKTHKTGVRIGQKDYMDATKEECNAVAPGNPDDAFTIEFKTGMMAFNNMECRERPSTQTRKHGDPIFFQPSVSIPNTDFTTGKEIEIKESTITLANYIVAIFKYSIGIIGIIAAIVLMLGGVMWLTAGGNHEKIDSARTMITSSLVGMCLAFGSFLILSIVNTNLVHLKIPAIQKIENIPISTRGCCKKFGQNPLEKQYTTIDLGKNECEKLKEQIGPDGYKDVVFIPYALAKNNECDLMGCCNVAIGSQLTFTVMYESVCKEKMTFGNIGQGFILKSQEWLSNKKIGDSCYETVEN